MDMRRTLSTLAAAGIILTGAVGLSACGSDGESTTTTPAAATTVTTAATTAAGTTMATEMATLVGESTYLLLNSVTAETLTENGVAVAPAEPAVAADGGIVFPITGQEVDAATLAAGVITHTGGLTFTAGGTELTATDFSVDLGTGILTATLPDGSPLPLLNLDLSAVKVNDTDAGQEVAGAIGRLTAEAATALNGTFGVELFNEGMVICLLDLTLVVQS